MYGLKTDAWFDSAHFLTDYYGKCENLHGHRWRMEVTIGVDDLKEEGTMRDMVLDFGVFKKAVRALADRLDHTFLVEEGSSAQPVISLSVRSYTDVQDSSVLRSFATRLY